jgi:hypothetical protein
MNPAWWEIERASSAFVVDAGLAVRFAYRRAWRRSAPLAPQEPDYVAALTIDGTRFLARRWLPLFDALGYRAQIGAIFCHQSPMVRWTPSACCELGDILFVHVHYDGRLVARRALLLQAKQSTVPSVKLAGPDLTQLTLYERWPQFRYEKGKLRGQTRDVFPKTPNQGAQYLLVDSSGPAHVHSGAAGIVSTAFPMAISPSGPVLVAARPLENALVGLLTQREGRPFGAPRESPTGWTRVVWDLIESAAISRFNRRRAGFQAAPRGAFVNGASVHYKAGRRMQSELGDLLFSDGPPDLGGDRSPEDDGGVSVVAIQTFGSQGG